MDNPELEHKEIGDIVSRSNQRALEEAQSAPPSTLQAIKKEWQRTTKRLIEEERRLANT